MDPDVAAKIGLIEVLRHEKQRRQLNSRSVKKSADSQMELLVLTNQRAGPPVGLFLPEPQLITCAPLLIGD